MTSRPLAVGSRPNAAATAREVTARGLGVYVHVPFCSVRCGYCDFNTYAPGELGGATPEGYVEAALAEIELAKRTLGDAARPASTVFFGGGTPTMLNPGALARLLDGVEQAFGLAAGVEVTTEANPDSVTPGSLDALAASGFTRVSLGMQSAVPHVLRTLDRTHEPANVSRAVAAAREAGLDVSLDLIYGTPGESLDDWRRSLDAALALEPDHLSAYALVIEPGTRMGAQLQRGEVPPVDLDVQADMYEAADEAFTAAGYSWYEVSNWTRGAGHECRHNLGYWLGHDWWGIGPGAHSHWLDAPGGPRRWWNVKHPRAYAQRLADGETPEDARENLTPEERSEERVLLGVRLAEGLPIADVSETQRGTFEALVRDGLVDAPSLARGRIVLTRRGRLLADAVVRALV